MCQLRLFITKHDSFEIVKFNVKLGFSLQPLTVFGAQVRDSQPKLTYHNHVFLSNHTIKTWDKDV